jgi:predicted TIM-barrel fold metal-dependent hydrolase
MSNEEPLERHYPRRSFIKKAGIGVLGLGIAGSIVSESEAAKKSSLNPDSMRIKDDVSPIIDVHRHWLPETKQLLANYPTMAKIAEYMVGIKKGSGNEVIMVVEGITSVFDPRMGDLTLQLEDQKRSSVTKSILSMGPGLETICKAAFWDNDGDLIRQINDVYLSTVAEHPEQLESMVNVNPFRKDSVKECERCINDLGAKGISIPTSWEGEFVSSSDVDFFWEYSEDRGIAVFMHPAFIPYGIENMHEYKLEEVVGRPCETALCITKMIYSGVFDRFPKLKVVLPHMGGALPNIIGRLDFAYRMGYEGFPAEEKAVCKRMPSDYLKTNLFVDIMGFSSLGIRHVIDLFGADRVLFGTDYGPIPFLQAEHVTKVRALELRPNEEESILWKNAAELFKLV